VPSACTACGLVETGNGYAWPISSDVTGAYNAPLGMTFVTRGTERLYALPGLRFRAQAHVVDPADHHYLGRCLRVYHVAPDSDHERAALAVKAVALSAVDAQFLTSMTLPERGEWLQARSTA
jgi:hypothetical protein